MVSTESFRRMSIRYVRDSRFIRSRTKICTVFIMPPPMSTSSAVATAELLLAAWSGAIRWFGRCRWVPLEETPANLVRMDREREETDSAATRSTDPECTSVVSSSLIADSASSCHLFILSTTDLSLKFCGRVVKPPGGTLHFLWHRQHSTVPVHPFIPEYSCKQDRQNVCPQGRSLASCRIPWHMVQDKYSSSSA